MQCYSTVRWERSREIPECVVVVTSFRWEGDGSPGPETVALDLGWEKRGPSPSKSFIGHLAETKSATHDNYDDDASDSDLPAMMRRRMRILSEIGENQQSPDDFERTGGLG